MTRPVILGILLYYVAPIVASGFLGFMFGRHF
jgi:hypothetical protein